MSESVEKHISRCYVWPHLCFRGIETALLPVSIGFLQLSRQHTRLMLHANPPKSMASQKADIIHSPPVVVRRSSRPVGVHVLSPTDVPLLVQSFFDHERAVHGNGQMTPSVTIHIFQAQGNEKTTPSIFTTTGPRALVFRRLWLQSPTVVMQIWRSRADTRVRNSERVFHFTSEFVEKLKAKANANYSSSLNKISSFQFLFALVWRCITQVCNAASSQVTTCVVGSNKRSKPKPPLSQHYFGNFVSALKGV